MGSGVLFPALRVLPGRKLYGMLVRTSPQSSVGTDNERWQLGAQSSGPGPFPVALSLLHIHPHPRPSPLHPWDSSGLSSAWTHCGDVTCPGSVGYCLCICPAVLAWDSSVRFASSFLTHLFVPSRKYQDLKFSTGLSLLGPFQGLFPVLFHVNKGQGFHSYTALLFSHYVVSNSS